MSPNHSPILRPARRPARRPDRAPTWLYVSLGMLTGAGLLIAFPGAAGMLMLALLGWTLVGVWLALSGRWR